MKSKLKFRALVMAGACLFGAGVGRADLLDEEPEPTVKQPEPTPPPAKKEKPAQPPKAGKTASPGPSSPSQSGQTVLPPKGPSKKPAAKKENEPVHFESKGLKALREKGTAELVDDVVVTQGDLRLESDHAQVFFNETTKDVEKVVAEGDVKIFTVDPNTGEKLRVFTNHATFENRARLITADGNVRLWRGNDGVVRMKKATYEMDTGWIKGEKVDGQLSPSSKDQKDQKDDK